MHKSLTSGKGRGKYQPCEQLRCSKTLRCWFAKHLILVASLALHHQECFLGYPQTHTHTISGNALKVKIDGLEISLRLLCLALRNCRFRICIISDE